MVLHDSVNGFDEDANNSPIVAQELQNIMDTVDIPIFGSDNVGKINEWNLKTEEIIGFSREEVLKKPLISFIAPEYKKNAHEMLSKALNGSKTTNFTLPFISKSKQTKYFSVNVSSRRNIENNIVGGKTSYIDSL